MKLINALLVAAVLVYTTGCQTNNKPDYGDLPPPEPRFSKALNLLKQNKLNQAEHAFNSLSKDYPMISGPLVNLAIIYSQTNRSEEAIPLLEKAIQVNPKNHDAYLQLGLIQKELTQYKAAASTYQKGLVQHPNSYSLLLNRAILLDIYLGRLDDALSHYEKAHKLDQNKIKNLKSWISDIRRRIANQQTS